MSSNTEILICSALKTVTFAIVLAIVLMVILILATLGIIQFFWPFILIYFYPAYTGPLIIIGIVWFILMFVIMN